MPATQVRFGCLASLAFVLLLASPAHALDCDNAVSTPDLSACSGLALKAAEVKLNRTYQETLKRLQQPGGGSQGAGSTQQKLVQAQRAWIRFRQADCDAVLAFYAGGSIRGLMVNGCMQRHAERRTEDLQAMFGPS